MPNRCWQQKKVSIRTIDGGMFSVFMWECSSSPSENPDGAPGLTLDDSDENGVDECSAVVKLEMMSPLSLNFGDDDVSSDSVNEHQHQYVDADAFAPSPSPVGDRDADDGNGDSANGSQLHQYDSNNSKIDEPILSSAVAVDQVSFAIAEEPDQNVAPTPSVASPTMRTADNTPTSPEHPLVHQTPDASAPNTMTSNFTEKTFGK